MDITNTLIPETNTGGNITNSDLNLDALILHKDTLLSKIPEAVISETCYRPNNTTTVSWITREASAINPDVADLPHICALHSIL